MSCPLLSSSTISSLAGLESPFQVVSWHDCHRIQLLSTAVHWTLAAIMSLASSPDFHIRPEDKAIHTLLLTDDDPLTSSFDDYLNENYHLSDSDHKEKESFEDFFEFFEKEARANGNRCPTIDGSARQHAASPQPWRKGLWCLNQTEASLSEHGDSKDSSAPNANHNVPNIRYHVEHKTQDKSYTNFSRPRSPPRTPSYKGIKRQSATSPKKARKSRYVRQEFLRESTLSPRSMYARNQHNNGMAYQESLQQHLQDFHLPMGDDDGTPSPQSSRRRVQQEKSRWMDAANVARNGTITQNAALIASTENSNGLQTPARRGYGAIRIGPDDPPPFKEQEYIALDPGFGSPSLVPDGMNMMSSPNPDLTNEAGWLHGSHDHTGTSWKQEPLGSPVESGYLYHVPAHLSLQEQGQSWWSPQNTSATQPDAPGSYEEFYPIIAAPTPHRPTHQLIQNPTSPNIPGLGIHYAEPSSANAYPALSSVEPTYQYPPLPQLQPLPEPIQTFENPSPFTTPRHRQQLRLSPSRSPSPSVSPTNTSHNHARSLRAQTSPARSSARRKSIGAPKASSFNTHHHKSYSSSSRTPKSPGAGFGSIDFVNFTPKDSAKLLSDVAPSGSSKTRARREQEARDKRRRLSEAAVKVVRRAAKGGDVEIARKEVEALERAILA